MTTTINPPLECIPADMNYMNSLALQRGKSKYNKQNQSVTVVMPQPKIELPLLAAAYVLDRYGTLELRLLLVYIDSS